MFKHTYTCLNVFVNTLVWILMYVLQGVSATHAGNAHTTVNDQINSINATINKRGRETLKERYPQGAQDPCAKYCRYLTLFRHA